MDTKEFKKPKFKKHESGTYIILFFMFTGFGFAQNNNPELDSLVTKGIANNNNIKAMQLQVDKAKASIKTAYSIDKTNVYYSYDQNNLAVNNEPLKVFGVQQSFAFPTVYGAHKKVLQAEYEKENSNLNLQKSQLTHEISIIYNQIVYLQHQEKLYNYLDSLYQNFSKASDRRFELGESNYLEKITAQAKFRQINTKLIQIKKDKIGFYDKLKSLVQTDEKLVISSTELKAENNLSNTNNKELYNSYYENVTDIYKKQISFQKQQALPDLHLEYFQGKNTGLSSSLYGFQVGVSIPLFFNGNVAKNKVAKIELQSWEAQKENEMLKIEAHLNQQKQTLEKFQEGINYYNQYGKKLSEEIIKVADMSYKHGEIDFFQYIMSLENATSIQMDYLETLLQYNLTQLNLQYITLQ